MALHLSKELTESILFVTGDLQETFIVEDTDLEDLDEASIPGDAPQYQKHLAKQMAGEKSKTDETGRLKNWSNANSTLADAMSKGHPIIVHHHAEDGSKKAIALVHATSSY